MKNHRKNNIKSILISLICIWVGQTANIYYDTHNQTIGFHAIKFDSPANKTYQFTTVYEKVMPRFQIRLTNPITTEMLWEKHFASTSQYSFTHVMPYDGIKAFISQLFDGYYDVILGKLYIKQNGKIIKFNQFTIMGTYHYLGNLLVPIVTTKSCKVNFEYISNHKSVDFLVYRPTLTRYGSVQPYQTFPQGITNFDITLDGPGTWFVAVRHNSFYWKQPQDVVIKVTTDQTNACSNPCHIKGSNIQMLPGTKTNQCMCDPTSGIYYNPKNSKCQCIDYLCGLKIPGAQECGNGIVEGNQLCDNGNITGCKNDCKPDSGYTCTNISGEPSNCTRDQYCGNNIKSINEQCDNGGTPACTNCLISPGFTCTGNVGQRSNCFASICGDSIIGNGQQCDNGNKTGCKDCKIVTGYVCNRVLGQISNCSSVCGNGIKTKDQQCDNKNKTGCINCHIAIGYACISNLYAESLCYQICGDGIRTETEDCDTKGQPGCSSFCKIEPGYSCIGGLGQKSSCQIRCGDGIVGGNQKCDNKNKTGCSSGCMPDLGYKCTKKIGQLSQCSSVCGDRIRTISQACDNGMNVGCLNCSAFDNGFNCTGELNAASSCRGICGDKIRISSENCDNGNKTGCSLNCKVDPGYICTGGVGDSSVCSTICGDFIKAGDEQCDNGKKDGCKSCKIQQGYTCRLLSNGRTSICIKR